MYIIGLKCNRVPGQKEILDIYSMLYCGKKYRWTTYGHGSKIDLDIKQKLNKMYFKCLFIDV